MSFDSSAHIKSLVRSTTHFIRECLQSHESILLTRVSEATDCEHILIDLRIAVSGSTEDVDQLLESARARIVTHVQQNMPLLRISSHFSDLDGTEELRVTIPSSHIAQKQAWRLAWAQVWKQPSVIILVGVLLMIVAAVVAIEP